MARATLSASLGTALLIAATQWAAAQAADPTLVARGKELFNDTKLSASGQYSCATCHPANGHTDNKTYVGLDVVADGDPKGRSTPTLWGAGQRSAYSWAGTAPSLEANIRGIIVNRMKGPEPSPDQLAALAAYVRSLAPPQNPHVNADGTPARTAPAQVQRGFDLFTGKAGCGTCHVLPSFDKKETEDVGSGGKFKVPSLRAVTSTGPWFNDGRFKSLPEAVRYMWEFQSRKAGNPSSPTDAELADIVAYLSVL
jgi:cytochrome c peroxidase